MQIFYIPEINGQIITLSEEESKHCVRVLRLQTNDPVQVVDGKGNLFHCTITEANPKRCLVKVNSTIADYGKRRFHLHLAIAPTKNIDRFEWFVEKATEIGIDEITPMVCEHSERKMVNLQRLERIMISAMKQSAKAKLPSLNTTTSFERVVRNAQEKIKLIAYCGEPEKPHAHKYIDKGKSIIILIGPEGDFSPTEMAMATSNNFHTVSLGTSRLRTETAGIVACALANFANDQ